MVRSFLIELNPVKLKNYSFMISLDKCSGSCNSVDDLSRRMCVSSKTKNVSVKVLNMIKNKTEAKTLVQHTSCDCKCKFNSTACNSNQKWNNEKCQCECKKKIKRAKKIVVGILANAFVKMGNI